MIHTQINYLEWQDMIIALEDALGMVENHAGEWNAPDEPHFTLDRYNLKDHYGYYRGESKILVKYCLDKPHNGKFVNVNFPKDPIEFLNLRGVKSENERHPEKHFTWNITVCDALEYLVVIGLLPRGKEIILNYEW